MGVYLVAMMGTNSQPSNSKSSASFDLLDPRIQKWIWSAGWTELRDAQEQSIPLILDARDDIIIAAATASGKTEAAFFPILTALLKSLTPRSALYISPLKALINDQWERLDRLCAELEIQVVGWHGDISSSRKKAFFKNPSGCLLITPESLEGLLIREGHALKRPFGGLSYIVIDELHAFIGTERGKQLQSLMHRIDTALGRRIVRIGLSATLGEMQLAGEFLRPGRGQSVRIIESSDNPQEQRVIVRGYRESLELETDQPSSALREITNDLYKTLRGSNNLVFPNRRALVEFFSDGLRLLCERDRLPNEFWPHHGSLSKEIRALTEQALKEGTRPATAIATNTLELGIDIGTVTRIAQVGPAPSVASLRQRLGRSGRRGEPSILHSYSLEREVTPDGPISDQLRQGLVQTTAQIRLLAQRWYEPPQDSGLHYSTLIQQLLSSVAQSGGVSAVAAWRHLCESGIFPGISKAEFKELLTELGKREILFQDSSGLLLLGEIGERVVNHYSFLAAFSSDEEFKLMSDGRTLGTLPLSRPVAKGSYLIFAGRRWQVIDCIISEKIITVTPARGGKIPIFDGMGSKTHNRIREEMRLILTETAPVAFLDLEATAQLMEARQTFLRLNLGNRDIIQAGGSVFVFTWKGDRANDTLALMLLQRGFRVSNEGTYLAIIGAKSEDILEAIREIAETCPPPAGTLGNLVQNKFRQKWDWLLTDNLLTKSYEAAELDIPEAQRTARLIRAS